MSNQGKMTHPPVKIFITLQEEEDFGFNFSYKAGMEKFYLLIEETNLYHNQLFRMDVRGTV